MESAITLIDDGRLYYRGRDAAALVIGFSQLKHLLGFNIPRSHLITETIGHAVSHISQLNPVTFGIAAIHVAEKAG